jgi:hypothetical protein
VSAAESARFLPLCNIVGLSFLPAESSEGLPEIGYCEDYVRSLRNSNERRLIIKVCKRYFDDLSGQPWCFFAAGISGYGPDLLGWIFEEGWIRLGRPWLRLRRCVSGTTL